MPNQTIPATEANRRRIGRGISFAIILASVVVAVGCWIRQSSDDDDETTLTARDVAAFEEIARLRTVRA